MSQHTIRFTLNGQEVEVDVPAERLLVVIRCGPATTLLDLNAICRAIGAEAAPAVPILVAAPVADGPPVVAVIAIVGVEWHES